MLRRKFLGLFGITPFAPLALNLLPADAAVGEPVTQPDEPYCLCRVSFHSFDDVDHGARVAWEAYDKVSGKVEGGGHLNLYTVNLYTVSVPENKLLKSWIYAGHIPASLLSGGFKVVRVTSGLTGLTTEHPVGPGKISYSGTIPMTNGGIIQISSCRSGIRVDAYDVDSIIATSDQIRTYYGSRPAHPLNEKGA